MSLPVLVRSELPTSHHKDRTTSLVVSRCDCSLPQCVHAFLILPLFVCQNSVSHYTNSGFLDHYSGRSTNFYLERHKTVTTCSPWHHRTISFRVNQSHYNLFCMSWRVCLYAFLALRLPRMCTHSCAQTPAWTVSLLSCPPPALVSSCSFQLRALATCEAACPRCASSRPALPASPRMFLLLNHTTGTCDKSQTGGAWHCTALPGSWFAWRPHRLGVRQNPLNARPCAQRYLGGDLRLSLHFCWQWQPQRTGHCRLGLPRGFAAGSQLCRVLGHCWHMISRLGLWILGLSGDASELCKEDGSYKLPRLKTFAKGGQVRQTGPFSCLRSHPSLQWRVEQRDEHFLSK